MRSWGFGLVGNLILVLAILGTLAGIIAWADRNIATTAGVKKGAAAKQVEWDAAVEDARERETRASLEAAKLLADERRKRKTIIEERTVHVEKIIDRPVYRNVCFDVDGLRCANAALLGSASAAGCKPDGGVPGTQPTR